MLRSVRLYAQGNYQQASDRFQQAIAQDPASPEGYYNLAASLQQTGTTTTAPPTCSRRKFCTINAW